MVWVWVWVWFGFGFHRNFLVWVWVLPKPKKWFRSFTNFNKTKIGRKCQNWKMRLFCVIFKQCCSFYGLWVYEEDWWKAIFLRKRRKKKTFSSYIVHWWCCLCLGLLSLDTQATQHSVRKSQKKSHSTLRAKRAFEHFEWKKFIKNVKNRPFLELGPFLDFVRSKCKCSSLRSQCWMRLFGRFSNTVT